MREDTYRLTPFELAMYLAQLADPSSTEYSVDCYFDISGSKKEAVHSAVSDMIRNHEILHSRYETEKGVPVRILTDDYPRIHWTAASSPTAVKALALQEKVPFDLKEVPVRFTGYELPEGRILIRMEIHHIAFDGRSVMIWQRELFERLRGNSPVRENDLALQKKARLVQISTLSIGGFIDADKVDSVVLHETDYDLGQKPVIKYIASKFEAEGAILDAMENHGLRAKIIRIGNLMGRRSDGEFQINFCSNGFINRLGFSWPLISPHYLQNNLRLLSEMGFFDLNSHM